MKKLIGWSLIVSMFLFTGLSVAATPNDCKSNQICLLKMPKYSEESLVINDLKRGNKYSCEFINLNCKKNGDINKLYLRKISVTDGITFSFLKQADGDYSAKQSINGYILFVDATNGKWSNNMLLANLGNDNHTTNCRGELICK